MSNEHVMADYIREKDSASINTEWVLWMLDILWEANSNGHRINPEWLRANPTGWHTPAGFIDGPEPPFHPTPIAAGEICRINPTPDD